MKIRVLHVYPQLNCGGTEMVLYNLIKFGSHDKFQYEILVQREGNNDDIVKKIGVPIHIIPYESSAKYKSKLAAFFKKEKFDIIHTHTHAQIPQVLSVAKSAGINRRIVHSHCARTDLPKFLWAFRFLLNHRYEKYATTLLGCSTAALKWLFPTNWKKGIVLYNGIDLSSFQFDRTLRQKIRDDLRIPISSKVHIYVGRFAKGKNHSFILRLAKQNQGTNEYFILIGDGPELPAIQASIKNNDLINVLCVGRQRCISQWLSAADDFLFPSKFEGLGIVAVEAQAIGLRTIVSEAIPDEANIGTETFEKVPLKRIDQWLKIMRLPSFTEIEREELVKKASTSNYNILNTVKQLESIYIEEFKM